MPRTFILLIIILICFTTLVKGQVREDQRLPSLNGHTYIPIALISGPFTNSYFNSNLGVAQSTSLKVPIDFNGQTYIGQTGKLVFLNLGFQYQQRIKDWIAFNGSIFIRSRIGTDVRSILAQGINTVSGFQLEWVLKIMEKDKHQLSGAILVNSSGGSFVNILGYVEDVIDSVANPTISESVPATNTGVGLRYAYGINSTFGLRILGDIRYGESLIRGDAGFSHRFGAVLDVDLNPKTDIPIGLAFAFANSSVPENVFNEKQASNLGNLKIAYTGTTDFSLGINLNYQIFPVSYTDDKLKVIGASISTCYYFN